MNPASRLITFLGLDENTRGQFFFTYCVLSVLAINDRRLPMQPNPVDDIFDRIREAGIDDNSDAFIELRQLLEPTREHFRTC